MLVGPYAAKLVTGLMAAGLVCALVPSVARAQVIQEGAQSRREIRGVVTDSAARRPLVGASVSVAETHQNTVTDSLGRYRLAALFPAAVTVTFQHIGYSSVTRRITFEDGRATLNAALPVRAIDVTGFTVTPDSAASFLAKQQVATTMGAQEVEQNRGQTLGETIKEMPGVAIIQYGPSIAKPVVRGLHSQRIATVNNGVPLEGQQWGGEHAPEVDAFAANEIEVIRGPGTILYGSGALGGVVRVVPRPLPAGGGFGGELSTNAFLNNRQGASSLLLEGAGLWLPLLGTTSWRAQVSGRRAADARTPDYYLPNTGFAELDYDATLGVSRAWGHSELTYSHYGTHLGMYVGAHVGNLDDLERAMQVPFTTTQATYTLAHPDQKVIHDMVAWNTAVQLARAGRIEVAYGFQHNNRREFDNHGFAAGGKRAAFALELYTHSLDLRFHHEPIGPFVGSLGVSGVRQGNLSPGRSFLIPQYRLYSGGVFALEEARLSRLTLTAGARYDYRWQHAYQYGAPVVVSPDDERSYLGASGSLGASLRLAEGWSIASTLGRAWRPPNVNERFSQGVHHGTAQYEIGDSSLVPEKSINADATLRHQGARTRLELSVFRNHIDDYIFLRPREPISTVRGAYPAYNYAHTDALLRGVEVTAEATPASWLSLYVNGNLLRGTDRATGDPLYDMPADRLTASARFYPGDASWLTAPYLEIGTTQVRRQTHVPPVTIYKLPTAGYGLLNVAVGASAVQLGGVRIQPSLAVNNVLDHRYRDYLSRYRLFVDDLGRDVVLRLTTPFGPTRR